MAFTILENTYNITVNMKLIKTMITTWFRFCKDQWTKCHMFLLNRLISCPNLTLSPELIQTNELLKTHDHNSHVIQNERQ